jgi:ABC-type protease/lipase transport system fused ATPase/permease subunit
MRERQRTETAAYFPMAALRVAGGSRLLTAVCACTAGINLMALTGPAYMVVLYDRVLNTGDAQYLAGMTALMLVLYALGAVLDIVRHGVLLRCAQRTDRTLSALLLGKRGDARAIADLDRLRAVLGGHAPAALCDLPWVPLYLCVLFLLHPLLGLLAAMGGVVPVACLIIGERRSAQPARQAAQLNALRWALPTAGSGAARSRWLLANAQLREAQDASMWPTLVTGAVVRSQRAALQSAMLGLGAYLVMSGTCHAPAMLAAPILLARVLGPVESAIAHWRSLAAARDSALRLYTLLALATDRPRASRPPMPTPSWASAPRVQIILRSSGAHARRANCAGGKSASSDLRPTAE